MRNETIRQLGASDAQLCVPADVFALRANTPLNTALYPAMRISAAVLGFFLATSAWAQESAQDEPKRFVQTLPGMILVGEGLILANAGMATLDPQIYGGLLALLAPLGGSETDARPSMYWTGLAAAEGLAAYHISELDKDEDTDKDIFLSSVVGWHAFAAILGVAYLIVGEDKKEPIEGAVHYQPVPGGGMVKFSYEF